jgi:hypothetical protein
MVDSCGYMNEQPRTEENGWFSSLGLGKRLINLHRKENILLRNVTKGLGLAVPSEHGNEISGSVKGGEFLDKLSDYQLLKEDYLP